MARQDRPNVPEIWRNRIPMDRALTPEEKVQALSSLADSLKGHLHSPSVSYMFGVYCRAIIQGWKVKHDPKWRSKFMCIIRKVPKVKEVILAHTEPDKTKWISEQMAPYREDGNIVNDPEKGLLYVWTYRNGLFQQCDKEGNRVEKQVILSQITCYSECRQYRR